MMKKKCNGDQQKGESKCNCNVRSCLSHHLRLSSINSSRREGGFVDPKLLRSIFNLLSTKKSNFTERVLLSAVITVCRFLVCARRHPNRSRARKMRCKSVKEKTHYKIYINGDIASRGDHKGTLKMEARNFLYSNWIVSTGRFLIIHWHVYLFKDIFQAQFY